MSDVFLPCEKGCGDLIAVDADMYRNSILLGEPVRPQHDVCPGADKPADEPVEVKPLRRFRVQILVYEIPADADYTCAAAGITAPEVHTTATYGGVVPLEPIAGVGTTIDGESAGTVVAGPATAWLGQTWHRIQEAAGFADVTPTTAESPVP